MNKVSNGIVWSAIDRFSVQGVSFVLSIIIARIVSPSAYGLIVMTQVFLSISQLFIDGGFANALIQKKNRDEIDYSTVFIFNMVISFGLYFILFIAAPFIARFYEEPQLVGLTRVISLNLIFSSLSIVQRTRLTIALDFKTQTKAGLISVLISGIVGVVCAYMGFEVWALVIQGLLSQLVLSLGLMFYSKWMPKLRFSYDSFKGLFNYGSKLLVNNLLTSVVLQLYNLVIGKRFTSADLAFYNRGFTLSQFPSTNISDIMYRVIFPILSELQDKKEKLISAYFKYLHLSNFILLPIMGLFVVLASPLIKIVLTDKWLPSVPYIQIVTLNFILYPWMQQSGALIAAIGKSGLLLKAQIVKRAVSFAILIATIGFGIKVMCWGFVIGAFFETAVNEKKKKKELGISFRKQLYSQLDVFIITVVACFIVFLFVQLNSNVYVQLFVGGFIGVVVYILCTFLFKLEESKYFVEALVFLKKRQ